MTPDPDGADNTEAAAYRAAKAADGGTRITLAGLCVDLAELEADAGENPDGAGAQRCDGCRLLSGGLGCRRPPPRGIAARGGDLNASAVDELFAGRAKGGPFVLALVTYGCSGRGGRGGQRSSANIDLKFIYDAQQRW